jgi:hypothetical protein
MALGWTKILKEMNTSYWVKGRSARKVDDLTAICDPIFQTMYVTRRFTTLWASAGSYADRLAFFTFYIAFPNCSEPTLEAKHIGCIL